MEKLLHRLKTLFRQKTGLPPAPTEQVVDAAALSEVDKAPSQVERNLFWLPTNREPDVFVALMPPACPDLTLVDALLLQRYRVFVIANDPAGWTSETTINRDKASQLAHDLYGKGTDIGYCRGTESSFEIYWLMQCAAIVSLLAHGPQSEQFLTYRKHVDYYRDDASIGEQVRMFDEYVASRSNQTTGAGTEHLLKTPITALDYIDNAIAITALRYNGCPEFQIYSSSLIQLQFIKNVLLGVEKDKARLHQLTIGVWASKEFEADDPELASALGDAFYIGIQIARGLKIQLPNGLPPESLPRT
ncbi:immunity protein Tsi6 family protein [Pseudomonas sp. BF-R-24]|uniref:immunity protein Tsi6 family protein n=1 Tax=Pseudomonas sp. BF-R-24 TaxID=2832386 RepID=UPI001CBF3DCB|nr:immunity protein Tsi6 family protein [Pseudomonas sp. BF-R-24]